MPRTSPYLKGLIDTRARLAGDLVAPRRVIALAAAKVAAAELALFQAHASLRELQERHAGAEQELADCDRMIRKATRAIDPTKIKPISTRGRYGPRGALTTALCEYFKANTRRAIPTRELLATMEEQFGLVFSSAKERSTWKKNSLLRRVAHLAAAGLVEGLHGRKQRSRVPGLWRWKDDAASSLVQLEAKAVASGGSVVRAAADD